MSTGYQEIEDENDEQGNVGSEEEFVRTSLNMDDEKTIVVASTVPETEPLINGEDDVKPIEEIPQGPEEPPVPTKRSCLSSTLSYLFFTLQGFGTLLTWNAIINCPDFFLALYSDYDTWAMSGISGFYMTLNLFGLFCMTFLFGEIISFGLKTSVMYLVMFVPLILIGPVFGYIGGNQLAKLIITMLLGGLCGTVQSVLQNGVFGKAGSYGGAEVQAVMFGQGIVGIAMSLLRIITKAAFEDGSLGGFQRSVMVYFLIAAIGNLFCFVSVFIFAIFDIEKERNDILKHETDERTRKRVMKASRCKRYLLYFWFTSSEKKFVVRVKEFLVKGVKNCAINWAQYFNMFFIFTVSLGVFPGVSSIVPTTTFAGTNFANGWMGVVLAALFCFFDFLGRTMARFDTKINIRMVWFIDCSRVGFLIMFLFLVNPPYIFENDFISFILMAGLAFSNGFVSTRLSVETRERTFMHPKLGETYCTNSSEVATFAIVAGVTAGSVMSIGWSFLAKGIHTGVHT